MSNNAWTHRQFFHRGDDFFEDLLRRIREARTSVRAEAYIFETDALTNILLGELRKARERGCQIQILVDGFGSYYWLDTLAERCRQADVELRVWEPLPRNWRGVWRLLSPFQFRLIRWLRRVNRRDHRKITLIDDRIAFVGSMNFTQVHCESIMGPSAWRDSGVKLEGPAIRDLVGAFRLAWIRAGRSGLKRRFLRKPPELRNWVYDPRVSPLRLNMRRRDRRFLTRDLLRRLNGARNRVLIASAYFLPTRALWVALRKAARRGVRVEVIVPGPSDVPMVKWAAAGASRALSKAGVGLHEYQNRMMHAKYMVIDDWASIGSLNFNHRSLFHDLEVEATFDDAESVEALTQQWEEDRRASRPFANTTAQGPVWRRWLENLAFRWRYIL